MASGSTNPSPTTQDILSAVAANSAKALPSASSATGSSSLATLSINSAQQASDMFLKLLTTQLQHQDPEQPMDPTQFTNQLVQFSQIEQQIKTNDDLSTIISQNNANSTNAALGYLGMQVMAKGDTVPLKNGQASWTVQSPSSSIVAGTATITDAAGNVVSSGPITINPGSQVFTWSGRDKNGIVQPDGNYTLSVNAKDASGSIVQVSTVIKGTVSNIDLSGSQPVLLVGNNKLNLSDVMSVSVPSSLGS